MDVSALKTGPPNQVPQAVHFRGQTELLCWAVTCVWRERARRSARKLLRQAALKKHAVLMDWGTPLFQGMTLSGERPEPGSDLVIIKNRSEPDFGHLLPVRPTKRESVRERPERGPIAAKSSRRAEKTAQERPKSACASCPFQCVLSFLGMFVEHHSEILFEVLFDSYPAYMPKTCSN